MAISISKICSMGSSQTGLVGTIGYTLLKVDGTVEVARSTAAIFEVGGGVYGKYISFPDDFVGSIVWDTGGGSPVYAAEDCYLDSLVNMVLDDTDELQTNQGSWVTATGFSVPNEYDVAIAALQTDLDNPAQYKATGFSVPNEYDVPIAALQTKLDSPDQYKADVSNLDVLVSTRSAAGEYDTAIAALQTDLDNPAQYRADVSNLDVAVSTRNATTPPTVIEIRTEMDDNSTKLSDIVGDTDELQTNQGNWITATGFSVPSEYDTAIAALQTDLDNPNQYKADVSNLDVAVSSRNATTPPTVGEIKTWLEAGGSHLDNLHKLQGLDLSNPMTVTPTSRAVGTISLAISGDGKSLSIVTRTS